MIESPLAQSEEVESPMAGQLAQTEELDEMAEEGKRLLMERFGTAF